MKRSVLLIVFLVVTVMLKSQQTVEYLSIDGEQRSYIQYLPSNFNSSTEMLPVVFVLHGLGGSAQQMTTAGFNAIADTARFIAIYPQGKMNGFGQASWNNGTLLESTSNDVHFLDTLIQVFDNQLNIDLARVYFCGLSAGGVMSYRMALKKPEKIAAIASMAGTMSTQDLYAFSNLVINIPVMHWHGTADQVVPYSGTPVNSITLVAQTINFWKAKNSCSTMDSTIIAIPDSMNDGVTVDRVVYEDCFIDDELELWIFENGEHTWFHQNINDADGAIEFWNFFSRFENTNDNLNNPKFESYRLKVYPNPSSDQITVDCEQEIKKVEVLDISGKRVAAHLRIDKTIEVKHLDPGQYLLKVYTISQLLTKRLVIH